MKFWLLVIGFSLIGVVFFYIVLQIAERRRNMAKCQHCGWEGEMIDFFDLCPECGYYNWEYIND